MGNVAYFHTSHNPSEQIGRTLIEDTLMYFSLVWARFPSTLHEDQSNVIDYLPPPPQKKKNLFFFNLKKGGFKI